MIENFEKKEKRFRGSPKRLQFILRRTNVFVPNYVPI